jgi:hypothetical protein
MPAEYIIFKIEDPRMVCFTVNFSWLDLKVNNRTLIGQLQLLVNKIFMLQGCNLSVILEHSTFTQ